VGDMPGVMEFMAQGAKLGQLWMEGHFEVGDPLVNAGAEGPLGQRAGKLAAK